MIKGIITFCLVCTVLVSLVIYYVYKRLKIAVNKLLDQMEIV